MRECRRVQIECPDEQKHKPTTLGDSASGNRVAIKANRVVPCEERQRGHEGLPWHFDEDLSAKEGLPGVRFRGPFTSLVKRSLFHKKRHNLLGDVPEHGEKHEDGEHLVLQSLQGIIGLVEGEPSEKSLIKYHGQQFVNKGLESTYCEHAKGRF